MKQQADVISISALRLIETHDRGQLALALSERVQKVVDAVVATQRKGSVTLCIKIELEKSGSSPMVMIEPVVSSKIPHRPQLSRRMFVGKNGSLHEEDPNQMQFQMEGGAT